MSFDYGVLDDAPTLEPHKIEISSIKYDCASRVRFDETGYIKVTNHIHTPSPEELIDEQLQQSVSSFYIIPRDMYFK